MTRTERPIDRSSLARRAARSAASRPASWLGAVLGLGSACGSANETVTLAFPSESARAATDTLVATVLEPLERADDTPPVFVPCERIGSFAPAGRIRLGPGADPAAQTTVLQTDQVALPLDGPFTLGFDDLPRRADNPWGVIAVVFEARGSARVPLAERGRFREQASTLLSGCHCLRTRPGRFADVDPDLDAAVRDACPLLGGREGEPARARTVPLRPVVPPEFRIEPCGASVAAAPSDGRVHPGPAACVRTEPCANTASELCFDCAFDCPELDDRSGGAVEMRVVDPAAPTEPQRQIVLTDAQGRATPDLDVAGCTQSFEVEASLFGRASDVVRFRVDCVPELGELALEDEIALQGRVVAVEGVAGSTGAPPAVAVLAREVDVEAGRFRSRIETFEWFGGGLAPRAGTSTVFESRTAHGLIAFSERTDGSSEPLLGVAVATSSLADPVRNVAIHGFRVGASRLAPVLDAPLDAPCAQCDCGGLELCGDDGDCGPNDRCRAGRCRSIETQPCVRSETCGETAPRCAGDVCTRGAGFECNGPGDCDGDDLCVAGYCAPRIPCRCELVAAPDEQVVLRAADVDGDGWTDLAAGVSGRRTVTLHPARTGASGRPFPQGACSCARITPLASTFDLLELGGDDRTSVPPRAPDLATASPDGAHIRYAERVPGDEDRLTCGVAAGIGEPFEVRDVRAISARCAAGPASCPARDDLLVLGRLDLPGARNVPVVRVVYGESGDITNDPNRFEAPGGHASLFVSQPDGADEARDPQSIQTGDFNGDGAADFAVLFRGLGEVRVWLGSGAGAFTESSRARYATGDDGCVAGVDFAAVDLDADGRDELALLCDPTTAPRLLIFGESGR